jgi:uncharacterized membrane protein YkoI
MTRLPARLLSTCLAVAALAAAAAPAEARDKWKDLLGRGADPGRGGLEQRMVDPPRYDAAQAEGMSLDRAVDMVQRRFNARVVRAEEKRDGGQTIYRIRLLSADGRVFTVNVDPRTGEIR